MRCRSTSIGITRKRRQRGLSNLILDPTGQKKFERAKRMYIRAYKRATDFTPFAEQKAGDVSGLPRGTQNSASASRLSAISVRR